MVDTFPARAHYILITDSFNNLKIFINFISTILSWKRFYKIESEVNIIKKNKLKTGVFI